MPVGALHAVWRQLIAEEGVALEDALRVVISNVARATGLATKGEIAPGKDADLLILEEDLSIASVIARGRVFMREEKLVNRGMFDHVLLEQLA